MIRWLVRSEVDFTSVGVNNSYATHSESRNKSQIPDAAKENNLPPTQSSANTHGDEAASPSNMCSLHRDS